MFAIGTQEVDRGRDHKDRQERDRHDRDRHERQRYEREKADRNRQHRDRISDRKVHHSRWVLLDIIIHNSLHHTHMQACYCCLEWCM